MTSNLIGVYGASGFGREVMPLVRHNVSLGDSRVVFIDDNISGDTINSHEVISYQQFLKETADEKLITVAIANSVVRHKIMDMCIGDGIEVFDVLSQNSLIMDDVNIGKGFIISPFVTITSNVRIGKGFQANLYSYVAHDCVIGDYVTFAPSVKCNGNVFIEDHAYIGTGAIIKQGKPGTPLVIGEGAVIGMGAVVTKDVPAGSIVVGNPAKPLIR